MSEASEIKITTKPVGTETQVTGWVNGSEVMVMQGGIGEEWRVLMSQCLPTKAGRAAKVLECMNRVMETSRQHGAE